MGMYLDVTPKKKKVVEDDPPKKKKKKVVEDDDEAPKKKKVLAIADVKLKKITKLSSKAEAKTLIGANVEQIHQLLEAKNNEVAIPLIYRKILQGLVDVLPLAEIQVRKTKGAKGIYQVNTLISSIREVLNDIQASQDRSMLGHSLVEQVIKPTFSDLAQIMVREYAAISADAKTGMDDREFGRFRTSLLASRARLADSMTVQFREIKDGTIQFLER